MNNEEALKHNEDDKEKKASEVATDLHEQAGLVCAGKDEDGDLEWIGTKKQWERYEQLKEEEDRKVYL